MGRDLRERQEKRIDQYRGLSEGQHIDPSSPVTCLHFVHAHVYITSGNYRAEKHAAAASLNPSVGSAFTGNWVSVCSHVPAVIAPPFWNCVWPRRFFCKPIVSRHCSDPSDNTLSGLFVPTCRKNLPCLHVPKFKLTLQQRDNKVKKVGQLQFFLNLFRSQLTHFLTIIKHITVL